MPEYAVYKDRQAIRDCHLNFDRKFAFSNSLSIFKPRNIKIIW